MSVTKKRFYYGGGNRNSNANASNNCAEKSNDNTYPNFSCDPFRSMSLNEKRKVYQCEKSYLSSENISNWTLYYQENQDRLNELISRNQHLDKNIKKSSVSSELNSKISIIHGDITRLELDAIVCAANERCLGGSGVVAAVHKAAGPTLKKECKLLKGCQLGEAKITSGHKLPAKYVIHTVGPRGKKPDTLKSCYENSLRLAFEYDIKTLAFCCISTGVHGYPNRDAAHIALSSARNFLETHGKSIDRIVFCTYLSYDFEIYSELIAKTYFPSSQVINKFDEQSEDVTTLISKSYPNFACDQFRTLSLDEKRKIYQCGNSFHTLKDIPTWTAHCKSNDTNITKLIGKDDVQNPFKPNEFFNSKLSLWQGNITSLEVDAIVNPNNRYCSSSKGVAHIILKAAGPTLKDECKLLKGCQLGEAKITSGHKLPAKYVIHTVGPREKEPDILKSCYENSLRLALEHNIKTLAFCCISTGVHGYPNRDAAHIALSSARNFLETNGKSIDRIVFCTYLLKDFEIYFELMSEIYFPRLYDSEKRECKLNRKEPVEMDDTTMYYVPGRKVPCESDEIQSSINQLQI